MIFDLSSFLSLSLPKGTRQDHSASSVPERVEGKKKRSSPTQILDGSQRLRVEDLGEFYLFFPSASSGTILLFQFLYILNCIAHHIKNNNLRDQRQRLRIEDLGDFYFTTLRQAQGPFYYFFFLTSFSALRTILNLTIFVINAKGMGSSSGNWTEPFPCLYFDSSFWKDSIPVGVG